MKYVAYDSAGTIYYFYESAHTIESAPDGLNLLQVTDDVLSNAINTYKVLDGELVPKTS